MAIDNFSQIVDKGLSIKDYKNEIIYDNSALGHLLKVVPVKDMKTLDIMWP